MAGMDTSAGVLACPSDYTGERARVRLWEKSTQIQTFSQMAQNGSVEQGSFPHFSPASKLTERQANPEPPLGSSSFFQHASRSEDMTYRRVDKENIEPIFQPASKSGSVISDKIPYGDVISEQVPSFLSQRTETCSHLFNGSQDMSQLQREHQSNICSGGSVASAVTSTVVHPVAKRVPVFGAARSKVCTVLGNKGTKRLAPSFEQKSAKKHVVDTLNNSLTASVKPFVVNGTSNASVSSPPVKTLTSTNTSGNPVKTLPVKPNFGKKVNSRQPLHHVCLSKKIKREEGSQEDNELRSREEDREGTNKFLSNRHRPEKTVKLQQPSQTKVIPTSHRLFSHLRIKEEPSVDECDISVTGANTKNESERWNLSPVISFQKFLTGNKRETQGRKTTPLSVPYDRKKESYIKAFEVKKSHTQTVKGNKESQTQVTVGSKESQRQVAEDNKESQTQAAQSNKGSQTQVTEGNKKDKIEAPEGNKKSSSEAAESNKSQSEMNERSKKNQSQTMEDNKNRQPLAVKGNKKSQSQVSQGCKEKSEIQACESNKKSQGLKKNQSRITGGIKKNQSQATEGSKKKSLSIVIQGCQKKKTLGVVSTKGFTKKFCKSRFLKKQSARKSDQALEGISDCCIAKSKGSSPSHSNKIAENSMDSSSSKGTSSQHTPQTASVAQAVLSGRRKRFEGCTDTKETARSSNEEINSPIEKESLMQLLNAMDEDLWVQCDKCMKWRRLQHILDPSVLPNKWYCSMLPTKGKNSCLEPEENWQETATGHYIYYDQQYVVGSVVWALVPGSDWWPAMVDIDPDYRRYDWFSNSQMKTVSSYHVTFFGEPVTRAWVTVRNMKVFKQYDSFKKLIYGKKDPIRDLVLKRAVREANQALSMDVRRRRRTYAFVVRYTGKIGKRHSDHSTRGTSDVVKTSTPGNASLTLGQRKPGINMKLEISPLVPPVNPPKPLTAAARKVYPNVQVELTKDSGDVDEMEGKKQMVEDSYVYFRKQSLNLANIQTEGSRHVNDKERNIVDYRVGTEFSGTANNSIEETVSGNSGDDGECQSDEQQRSQSSEENSSNSDKDIQGEDSFDVQNKDTRKKGDMGSGKGIEDKSPDLESTENISNYENAEHRSKQEGSGEKYSEKQSNAESEETDTKENGQVYNTEDDKDESDNVDNADNEHCDISKIVEKLGDNSDSKLHKTDGPISSSYSDDDVDSIQEQDDSFEDTDYGGDDDLSDVYVDDSSSSSSSSSSNSSKDKEDGVDECEDDRGQQREEEGNIGGKYVEEQKNERDISGKYEYKGESNGEYEKKGDGNEQYANKGDSDGEYEIEGAGNGQYGNEDDFVGEYEDEGNGDGQYENVGGNFVEYEEEGDNNGEYENEENSNGEHENEDDSYGQYENEGENNEQECEYNFEDKGYAAVFKEDNYEDETDVLEEHRFTEGDYEYDDDDDGNYEEHEGNYIEHYDNEDNYEGQYQNEGSNEDLDDIEGNSDEQDDNEGNNEEQDDKECNNEEQYDNELNYEEQDNNEGSYKGHDTERNYEVHDNNECKYDSETEVYYEEQDGNRGKYEEQDGNEESNYEEQYNNEIKYEENKNEYYNEEQTAVGNYDNQKYGEGNYCKGHYDTEGCCGQEGRGKNYSDDYGEQDGDVSYEEQTFEDNYFDQE